VEFVPSLNSLRFLGALCVVLTHLGASKFLDDQGLGWLTPLVSGATGVTLFYVLSGFLLTSLAIAEVRKRGYFSFGKFFLRRALRLFPLYYLAIFCVFILHLFNQTEVSMTSYLYALGYSYNFVPKEEYNGLLGSFHTLGTEEHFYLLFGFVFMLAASCFHKFWYQIIPILFLSLWVLSNALRTIAIEFEENYFVERWTLFAIQPILIGVFSAFVFRAIRVESALNAIKIRGKERYLASVLTLIFLILFVSQVWVQNEFIMSVGFVLLIISLVLDSTSHLSVALSTRPLVYLGTISYGLYIWQAVVNGTGPNARWIQSPWLSTLLVFVMSMASYKFFENPILKLKNRFY
jgi:peptidoglycan/LPS O-acetylase OafA/YrhL